MIDGHLIFNVGAAAFMLLISVIGWFLRSRVEQNDKAIEALSTRVHSLELAAARDDVRLGQLISGFAAIGELKTEMALRYSTREDTATILGKLDAMQADINGLRERVAMQHRLGEP